MSRRSKSLRALAITFALTVPWVAIWVYDIVVPADFIHHELWVVGRVVVSGLAILGGSFLLAWGAETAEKDVPRAFAIAVLAVLAVAPEYAVDALYSWSAGSGGATADACASLSPDFIEKMGELPDSQINTPKEKLAQSCRSSNLAVANMTGANRILIGIGWSGIALFTVLRSMGASDDPAVQNDSGFLSSSISLDRDINLEIMFLFLATLWAFLVPLNGGIDILDMLVLVGLYVAYIIIILRGDIDPAEEHVGVPKYLQSFPKPRRVATVLFLFAYSGAMIFIAVEPFAKGLEQIGLDLGIPSFFMIQWIAPLASESPELIVVAVLVNKARSTAGFNALISSKLNQWTLLIGTLVVVYSISLGTYGALPFDEKQSAEIWLTAAQSFFAISILVNFEISVKESLVLLFLFLSQVLIEFLIIQNIISISLSSYETLLVFTVIYIVLGFALLIRRRKALIQLVSRTKDIVVSVTTDEPEETEKTEKLD